MNLKKRVQLIAKMTFLIIQKASTSKNIFQTLKYKVFIFLGGSLPVYVQGFQVCCSHALDCWTVCAWGSISFFLYHAFSWMKVDFFSWLLLSRHVFTRLQGGTDIWGAFIYFRCVHIVFKMHLILSAELFYLTSMSLK